MKLLIAEDDPRLLKSLLHIFKSSNYVVDGVSNGNDAFDYASTGEYDGLVLDIMMPGQDGITLLNKLRSKGIMTPALFLSARAEISQRVEGLDAGADDYLPKPFATDELLARVRAMLRRKENYAPEILQYGETVLNLSTFQLTVGDRSLILSGKEFQILEMIMRNPGNVIPTDSFITHIWGWETSVDTGVVWVHVSNLRKKLASLESDIDIRFIRGAGYAIQKRNTD